MNGTQIWRVRVTLSGWEREGKEKGDKLVERLVRGFVMLEKMRRNTLYSRSSAMRASPVPDLSAFNFLFHLLLLLFHFPLPLFIEICLPCSYPYLLCFTPFFLLLLPLPHPFVNLPFLHIICISFFFLSNLIAPALCSHYFSLARSFTPLSFSSLSLTLLDFLSRQQWQKAFSSE